MFKENFPMRDFIAAELALAMNPFTHFRTSERIITIRRIFVVRHMRLIYGVDSFLLDEDSTTLRAHICQLAATLPRGFLHKEKCGFYGLGVCKDNRLSSISSRPPPQYPKSSVATFLLFTVNTVTNSLPL
jgi:hypothetical protein